MEKSKRMLPRFILFRINCLQQKFTKVQIENDFVRYKGILFKRIAFCCIPQASYDKDVQIISTEENFVKFLSRAI